MTAFTHDEPGTPAASWRRRPEWASIPLIDPGADGEIDRVVVAAAHPDDESLGAGGLVARLLRRGVDGVLVLATAGEGSHPGSPTMSRAAMTSRRTAEAEAAWSALGGPVQSGPVQSGPVQSGPSQGVVALGLPDGGLVDHEEALTARLVETIGDGRRTLLLTPWCVDGHPDHDALGRAGRRAAYRTGARLLQYPVWFWHRVDPDDPVLPPADRVPWSRLRRVRLAEADRAAQQAAVACHTSQVAALSDAAGDEALLRPGLLAHFTGADEVYVAEPPADDDLDVLHTEHVDPWGTTTRWYERRKRDLTLACLPRRRFRRALDVGCSTGTLTAELAERADHVVAADRSPTAVRAARSRLADLDGVDVQQLQVPWEWPDGRFDLVVVSESGYFLSPAALDRLVERVTAALDPDGVVVLAHWRHPIAGWPLSGPDVHRRFRAAAGLPPAGATYADRDVEIVLLAREEDLPDPGA